MEKFNPYHQHLLLRCWATNPPKKVEELTVTLATSHASIHIWDNLELPMVQFDIYSCKSFTLEQVMECFESFGLTRAEWIMIDRNSKPIITSEGVWEKDN